MFCSCTCRKYILKKPRRYIFLSTNTRNMSSQVDELTSQLARTTVDTSKELSFEGRGLKLNTADDGEKNV